MTPVTFDIQSLPFNVPPQLKNVPVIHKENAHFWVSAHDEIYHEALHLLISHIQRISYSFFSQQLSLSMGSTSLDAKTLILVEPNKSNLWVAQLALKSTKCSIPCARLGEKEASFATSHDGFLQKTPPNRWPREFVLFDDAAYSGTQITGHVQALAAFINTRGILTHTIRVVIPFMTTIARKRLEELQKLCPSKIKIEVSSFANIPTIHEIFADRVDLLILLQQLYRESGYEDLFDTDTGLGLTYFDHKIPNWMSFLSTLVTRYIPGRETPSFIGRIIPNIKEPYKAA